MKIFRRFVMVLAVLAAAAALHALAEEQGVLPPQSGKSEQPKQANPTVEAVEKLADRSDLIVLGEVTAVHDGTARDAGMSYDVKVVEVLKGAKVLEIFKGKYAKGTLRFRSAGWVGYARYGKGEKVLLFLHGSINSRDGLQGAELLQLKPITYVAEEEQSGRGIQIWPLEPYLALVRGNSAAGGQPASPPTGPAPLASLSRQAREIAASMEPDWTLKDSGRDAHPAGWSGEAPCERLRFVHKTPSEQGDGRTIEIWLSPKSYKGNRLPFLVHKPPAACLHSVNHDRLLFLRVDYIGDDDPAMADLAAMLAERFGFRRAEDGERTPESVQGQGPPPPQPQWSERTRKAVAEIESQIDEMHSSVSYIGPPVPGNPYLMVGFEYREVPLPVIYPPGSVVYLPKRFRRQWLHDLAEQGFFDRANVSPGGQRLEWLRGPTYLLCVTSHESCWWEDLGWNAETGRRLDALRKALVGDAGRAMDTLLEHLAPVRKEWEKAVAAPPKGN